MAQATLTRDGTTISLPLVEEGGGSPLIARDLGKPESGPESQQATLNPRWGDRWSQMETFTLLGRFYGADAYTDAIALADFVKSHSNGEATMLEIDTPEFDGPIASYPAPEQDRGVTLSYASGWVNMVEVEVSLTRVENVLGGSGPTASTPTATGDGPITLSNGSDSVAFTAGVEVDRTVGRPNTELQRSTGTHPNVIDNLAGAFDEFELTAEFLTDAASTAETLVELVNTPLGRQALTLDFNGIFGMGAMDVVPHGSSAGRPVRQSAEQGTLVVPSLKLRRVTA